MQLTIKMREAIAQLPREFGHSLRIGRQMGRSTYKVTHETVTVYDATLTNGNTGNVWHCQYESNDDPEGRDWVGMKLLDENEYFTNHVSSHRDAGIQIIPGRKYKEEI